MKRPILLISLTLCASAVHAQQTLRQISWPNLKEQGSLTVGEVLEPHHTTPFATLRLHNPKSEARTFAILTISEPGITAPRYALTGKVRYEEVEGTGYLEMWNYFPDGGTYFSRTLGDSGPLQNLHGSSDWRPFTLPFYVTDTKLRPAKLDFNLVLPGRGTVYLSPLTLLQHPEPAPSTMVKPWWSDRTASLVGTISGLLGGSIGALIGLLATMGKARRLVLSLLVILFVAGLLSLTLGLAALLLSQPYPVYYPPLLGGMVVTTLPALLFRSIRNRFDEIELRKMKAMDVSAEHTDNPPE